VAVFGEPFVAQQLMNGRTFMVGCGALGCEFLKVSDRNEQLT
jgi:molybdopterin/thiamine biosynthesis adenylyltransferase